MKKMRSFFDNDKLPSILSRDNVEKTKKECWQHG